MSIFPRPLKKVLGKIIPFSLVDLIPTFNLGTGTADSTTYLRGDQTWAPASTGTVSSIGTDGLISGGPITTSGTITTSMNTGKLVGRGSSGVGIMEEITVGSGLTLTGANVLNNTATPTPTGYYGAFQDTTTQTISVINTPTPIKLNTVDLSNQVTVANNGSGNPTRITVANTGIYNIQWSGEFQNNTNAIHDVNIWIRINGVDVVGSNGLVAVPSRKSATLGDEGHTIQAWNYLLSLVGGDYVEFMWMGADLGISLKYMTAGTPPPSTASVIVTVTQQAGIMAGTGITALNSLTGSVQTIGVNGSGTDFNIVSTGTSHTLNLPTASAVNRGALSSANWSTFNGKLTPNTAITGATNTKITYDSNGLVTSGTSLLATDLPSGIDAAKINSGVVSNTEFNYLDGVTSAIQTQINSKQDTLVSATNIKTINGSTILGSGDLVVGASSGIFGVSNTSGVYTYYATLTLAMAAATSGNTIEMFADVTETGAVTITLKDGVTINGNGHTYTVSNAGTSDVFETTVAGTYRIYSLNVARINATGGYVLNAKNSVLSLHYFDNSYFITNRGGIWSQSSSTVQKFYNANITISGTGLGFLGIGTGSAVECHNSTFRGTSTASATLFGSGTLYNSTLIHEGSGTCGLYIDAFGCTIIARGGGHTVGNSGNLSNCSIYNFANMGHTTSCTQFNNCLLFSASSYGTTTGSTTAYRNCTIISMANIGAIGGIHRSGSIISTANHAANDAYCYGMTIQSTWNNAAGHGVVVVTNGLEIIECVIEVTNASANSINAAAAKTSKYANNAFKGATTSVNVNVTQLIVNLVDTKGNITI